MDYKRILKSQQLRFFILKTLSFIPDYWMVSIQYRIKLGRKLNLSEPERYTEKLQWYKLYYRNPLMTKCADKYSVREYIKEKGFEAILNDCYGVYDHFEEIDFSKLPNKFVIKTTDGTGGQNIFLCQNKREIDIHELKKKLNSWKNRNRVNPGREWAYENIDKSRFLIEHYLEAEISDGGLIDYKFFCFNGKAEFLYVIADRNLGDKCSLGIYDLNFKKMEATRTDEKKLVRDIKKPHNFTQMLTVAERLSEDFPHVRIDLYNIDGKIIFGEFTFYDGSGYMKYNPDSFDFELGNRFVLPKKR